MTGKGCSFLFLYPSYRISTFFHLLHVLQSLQLEIYYIVLFLHYYQILAMQILTYIYTIHILHPFSGNDTRISLVNNNFIGRLVQNCLCHCFIGFVSYTKDRFWITTSFSPYSIQKYNLDFHNKHCYYNHQSLD